MLLVVLTSQPRNQQTSTNTQIEPTQQTARTNTVQRDSLSIPGEPEATVTPYKRFTFEGLSFSVPDSWKVEASPRSGSLLAQPVGAKDIFSLPRFQINVETISNPDYIPHKEKHTGRTTDSTIPNRNRLVIAAYRDLRPLAEESSTAEVQNIQERLAILSREGKEYTVYFQYAGTGRNDELEEMYGSLIESLSYQ